ncbi:hypothetical protein DL96DRAFT_1707161 [Flagelloscypha sp. PMI_526]|nr:hypothetical protein DL96DRAFT_1707161 [Flagelloscypha sp. PMI_526]
MTVLSGEVDLQQLAELERVAAARHDECPDSAIDAIHAAGLCNGQEFMANEEIALQLSSASLSSPDSVSTVSTDNSFKSAISDIPCHHGPVRDRLPFLFSFFLTLAVSKGCGVGAHVFNNSFVRLRAANYPTNAPIDTARIAVKSSSSSAHEDAAIECNKLNLDSEDAASLSIRLVDQNVYSTPSSTPPKLQSSFTSSKLKQSFKTYADVYNAVQADPAAASELLTQPLCNEKSLHLVSSPINGQLTSKDEATSPKTLEPKMPKHLTTQPNWAMAPDEPEFNSSQKQPSAAPLSISINLHQRRRSIKLNIISRLPNLALSHNLGRHINSKLPVTARSSPAPLTVPEDQFPAHISRELHCASGHLPFLDRQMENDDLNHSGVPIPSWDVTLLTGQQNLTGRDHAHGQAAAMPDLSQISLSHQSQAASHSEEIWEAKASTGWDELATSNDFLHPRMPSGTHIQGQQDWQEWRNWGALCLP